MNVKDNLQQARITMDEAATARKSAARVKVAKMNEAMPLNEA